jgi:opacity protein-like surface antigen
MRYRSYLGTITLLLLSQGAIHSQPLTREVFVAIANGHLFRAGDNPIGSGPNFGTGIGLRHHSGLGFGVEVNRTLGLSAKAAPCGIVNIPCEGSARQGVTGATIVSVNARYEFTRRRVRPYVTGGAGALRAEGFSAMLQVSEQRAVFIEEQWRDTGFAMNFGGGVRIGLSRWLSLQPELRVYNATALSRANLSMLRPSVVLAFSW